MMKTIGISRKISKKEIDVGQVREYQKPKHNNPAISAK
jgi:hypothetical protein